jgi:hypothetical protein
MAKTGSTTGKNNQGFAEDLGKLLGTARRKAEGWLSQRHAIVKHLSDVRDTASGLLTQLGHEAAVAGRRGRRAVKAAAAGIQRRGPGRPRGSGRKTKRTLSAEARRAISEAQKKRWAAQRAASGKKK